MPSSTLGKIRLKNFPISAEGSFSEVLIEKKPNEERITMRVLSKENQKEISEGAEGYQPYYQSLPEYYSHREIRVQPRLDC